MSKKISELTSAASVAGTDLVVIVDGTSTTKRATVTQVGAAIGVTTPPTGTGFATVSGGVQDAAALAFPLPVSKGGTGVASLTIPASGLLVGTTDTQTLSGKVISDASNTLSVGIATSVTGLAAGVSSFLTVPTSSNLATAVTDETGSGALVFGTAPLFKTTINLNNPANTFKYVLTPAAIVADRILNLPLLTTTDTMVTAAFAQTLTNKTIVAASNTITDTSAALGDILKHDGTRFVRLARGSANQVLTVNAGGTDVAWAASAGGATSPGGSTTQVQFNDAGAFAGDAGMTYDKTNDVLTLAGAVAAGTTPATSGAVRLGAASYIYSRNAANTGDLRLLGSDGSFVYFGDVSRNDSGAYVYSGGTVTMYTNSDVSFGIIEYANVSASAAKFGSPIIGLAGGSSPYSAHGAVTYAFAADSNYTLTASEYVYDWIAFSIGAWTTGRTVTFPNPATLAGTYTKTIHNTTVVTITISNGGTTKTLAAGSAQRFRFSPSAVNFASPTWTP